MLFSISSVSFMKEHLDQDSMGIILLQNFLKEFFPGEVWWSIKCVDIFVQKSFVISQANKDR